jgi:serine/tyrosine/threonine adenylyltransferase
MKLQFDNRFVAELPGEPKLDYRPRQVVGAAWSAVQPTAVAAPRLLAWSEQMLAWLDLGEHRDSVEFVQVFAGNALLPGMQPFAANYGGHQFGHWAGQLGDGRAISLGEVVAADGSRHELQLKGAGPTPYSRRADGRAVLRSSLREFVCSEAMHHLGIPTTRALCLIGSGETVVRDMFYDGRPQAEPGAIVCRVAPSFLRFGSFELPASRGETDLLRQLVDFCIDRDFPELSGPMEQRRGDWFAAICERTALLMAHWMRVGFVHGVMNTDNLSVLGLSIDYGPYGWLEEVDPLWTPNTTDAEGRRYCYGRQPAIAQWNLTRLAGALLDSVLDRATLEAGLRRYDETFAAEHARMSAAKLGLDSVDEQALTLARDWFELMQRASLDFTLSYRALMQPLANLDASALAELSYAPAAFELQRSELDGWLDRYRTALTDGATNEQARLERMASVNPRYVARNFLAQEAIDAATDGDLQPLHRLQEVLLRPYDEHPADAAYARLRPEWARHRAGCSMLSCSS